MARPGPAVLDVAKMTNGLSTHENGEALLNAFQDGYGRQWTPDEAQFLQAMLALDALTLAVWCHRHDDQDGCMKMRGILNRLVPAPQLTTVPAPASAALIGSPALASPKITRFTPPATASAAPSTFFFMRSWANSR